MTKHAWASPCLPLWYVLDRFEEKMTIALGPDWATKPIVVGTLSFSDAKGNKYPMSKIVREETMFGGELWHLLRLAHGEGAEAVAMSIDVHIMDAQ